MPATLLTAVNFARLLPRPATPAHQPESLPMSAVTRPPLLPTIAAFGAGCMLAAMVHLNGELARHGGALFASFAAHATGTVAAAIALLALRRSPWREEGASAPPLWAYLGGVSGAATVVLSSAAVNSALALAGTLALGLVGQSLFSLVADRFGLFGLPQRNPEAREIVSLALIIAGSCLILWGAQA